MSNGDKYKGKAKEVAGKVTGNDELETEGKVQHKKGEVGEKAEETSDKIKGAGKGLTGRDDERR